MYCLIHLHCVNSERLVHNLLSCSVRGAGFKDLVGRGDDPDSPRVQLPDDILFLHERLCFSIFSTCPVSASRLHKLIPRSITAVVYLQP